MWRTAVDIRSEAVAVDDDGLGAYSQLVGLIRYRDQQHWVKTEHAIRADNQYVEKPQAVKAKAA